jgi:hypothetical protein
MPTKTIPAKSRIIGVKRTVPVGMEDFVRRLEEDNQEMRDTIIALQTQLAAKG